MSQTRMPRTPHVLVDARPLQLRSYCQRGIGIHLRNWLAAAQPLLPGAGLSISLLVDPAWQRLPSELAGYPTLPLALPGYAPRPSEVATNYDPDAEVRFDAASESFMRQHRVDLFHSAYPIAEEYFVPRDLRACPTVASLYDTIMLRNLEHYTRRLSLQQRCSYAERFASCLRAARTQTLTAASARDIAAEVGVPGEQIDVVSCGIGDSFKPLPPAEVARRLGTLGMQPGYVFAVSGDHYSKNFLGLLRIYGALDLAARARHPLVVRVDLGPDTRQAAGALMRDLGIEQSVRILGAQSEADMVALYNGAALLAHASLQEGFGLPIAEAMRCGTPVACSNASSMPEVGGGAAAYFDSAQPQDAARTLGAVLADPARRAQMRVAGLAQAARFNWPAVARAVLASYHLALDSAAAARSAPSRSAGASPTGHAGRRRRIAFWSPVNPQPSGVCDYSESLLEQLKDLADVDVFVDGYQPGNRDLFDEVRAFDYRAFDALHAQQPYDVCIYQLGNSTAHAYMIPTLLRKPSREPCPAISVLHDGTLLLLLKHTLPADQFFEEIAYCEGPVALQRARAEARQGGVDDYGYPLLRRVVEASASVIGHSRFVGQRAQAAVPGALAQGVLTQVISYGMESYEDDDGQFKLHARNLFKLPRDAFIFGVYGFMYPVKRIDSILQAFEAANLDNCYLYFVGQVGEFSPRRLRDLAADGTAARRARVIIVGDGYTPFDYMLLSMHAADAGINLRSPTTGETSATLTSLLGMGQPNIVSDVGWFAELPDDCVIKVPTGEREIESLTAAMRTLACDAAARRRVAGAARAYGRAHTWAHTAQQYMDFVERTIQAQPTRQDRTA
jgi:glycosyltransferase involved in cell wall biosynthesis